MKISKEKHFKRKKYANVMKSTVNSKSIALIASNYDLVKHLCEFYMKKIENNVIHSLNTKRCSILSFANQIIAKTEHFRDEYQTRHKTQKNYKKRSNSNTGT